MRPTVYGESIGLPGPEGWGGATMQILDVSVKYPPKKRKKKKEPEWAVRNVSVPLYPNKVTAFMGPSGCGKSTLLKTLNRMHDLYPKIAVEGRVVLDGRDVLSPDQDVYLLRSKVGMVFQKQTPFPMTIYDNIAFGIGLYEKLSKSELDTRVEHELRRAALWEEVCDRLHESALDLSGGQQQRLCIARTVAVRPEVILFDEPCSALDRISSRKIEELIEQLKADYTIAIVTHNEHQAARVADYIGFMCDGVLVEFDNADIIRTKNPASELTRDFMRGRFG